MVMAGHMLYVGSYAKEDAYRAALVFAAATAMVDYAKSRGFKVEAKVALLGDGVSLMKDRIAKTVKPKGRPGSLYDMIQQAVKAGVTIHC
jgi:predicted peroxiredoxin